MLKRGNLKALKINLEKNNNINNKKKIKKINKTLILHNKTYNKARKINKNNLLIKIICLN